MKNFVFITTIVLGVILGLYLGTFIVSWARSIVTYFTFTDLIGCYSTPVIVLGFLGTLLGIYLEDKIK